MEKRGILILVIVLIIGFSVGYTYNQKSHEEQAEDSHSHEYSYESDGWLLYHEGKYDEAIEAFKLDLERDPNNFYANDGMGWSLYQKAIYDEALDFFNKAIGINSNFPDAHEGKGWSHYNLKEYAQAIDAFEAALELQNSRYGALLGAGWSYYNLDFTDEIWTERYQQWIGHFDNSLTAFEKATLVRPDQSEPQTGLGYLHHWKARGSNSQEDYVESQKAFEKAIALDAEDDNALSGLAWTLIWLNKLKPHSERDYQRPIDLLEKSLTFEETWSRYYGIAFSHQNMDNFETARDFFEKAVELNPEYHGSYSSLGVVYYRLKYDFSLEPSYDKAKEYYEKSLELSSTNYYAYTGLGWVAAREKDFDLATQYFNQAKELNPDDSEGYNGLGFVAWRLGDFAVAEEETKKAISINPHDPFLHEHLGYIYLSQGKIDEARTTFSENADDGDFHNLEGLGIIAYLEEDYDQAAQLFQQQIESNPRSHEGFYSLGATQLKLGLLDEARSNFEQTLKLFPDYPAASMGLAYIANLEGNSQMAQDHIATYLDDATTYVLTLGTFDSCIQESGSDPASFSSCVETAIIFYI